MENWKDIIGYEGYYQVSDKGNIRNVRGNRNLKLSVNNNGYMQVTLTKDNKGKVFRVHRLVAQTFIPNPDNKFSVDHIDTDKTNNCVSNLRWVTHKENMNNPITKATLTEINKRTQTIASPKRRVRCITTGKEFDSLEEAANYYGLKCSTTIGAVCNGKRQTTGKLPDGTKLEWEYIENRDRKRVRCITTGKEFDNLTKAAEFYKIDRKCISKACLGKQKTAGRLPDGTKLEWKYID